MPLSDEANLSTRDCRLPARPYSGWVLDQMVERDRDTPGLLAASFRFGRQRRQASFLLLAFVEIFGIDEIASHLRSSDIKLEIEEANSSAVIGQAILRARHPRDLIRALLAGPPVGLLGTLARLGLDPVGEPAVYYELGRLYLSKEPADRRRAKVLSQIGGNLVGAQIQVVSILDPVLLHPAYVSKVYEIRQVAEIHKALDYVRKHCSGATDEAIRSSLGKIGPNGHRSDVIKGWAGRFDRLPTAIDTRGDPTLNVLGSADALADAGRRYRNCLATKVFETVLGSRLYIEFRPNNPHEPGVIAELRRTTQGWFLENLYAAQNRRVLPHRACIVRDKLAALGVAILAHAPGDRDVIDAAAQMLGEHRLISADCNGWGDEFVDAAEGIQRILDEAA